jgi:sterol desaturase/sphingolipid hydroxylase (fatty acid hydroxylase superfamily)
MDLHAPNGLMLIALVALIMVPLERLLPVHRQPLVRPQMVTDGLHAIHHSSTTLDWLATPRLHFVDQGLRQTVKPLPLALLGFTKESFGLVAVIGPLLTFLIHANVRLRWGPLRYLYTSPQFHHWHHALTPGDKNYSDQFPWLDKLFGTLHLPRGEWPTAYGVGEPIPAGWWRQIVHPFTRLRAEAVPPAAPSPTNPAHFDGISPPIAP